ncbi:MAG: 4-hydroxybutyrate CoA-transferase [Acidobacteria bacterium]|nr:4-hydroxybutyrate CoA-transferase [Acidobacteriota bacterium]
MNWTESYTNKLTTAEEAVKTIRSGQTVYVHQGCGEPEALVAAMVARGHELHDVEVFHMMTFGNADYTHPEFEGHFHHVGAFIGSNVREAVQDGRADYIPIFLHEIEGLFDSGAVAPDVALMHCSPPDAHGFMSLGPSIDVSLTAAKHSRHVLVEVNTECPRTFGDSFLHVSEANGIVETSHPLPEYHKPETTAVHRQIARHIAEMIPDGATLQTGVGGIPDAVLESLTGHRDLGIHTEMFSDGVIELIEAGVINNARKSLHPRKAISGFALGTRRLFRYIDNNPMFEFHRTAYVNDPNVIGQNDHMVAINAAIEVDLTGQVCADSMGTKIHSGIGGQVDFIRGAARSRGGLPIIAVQSTAKNDTISRITPFLKQGAGVVTSRGDVHYVISEYGVAYLHGKSLRQRAEALIRIAHPTFRDELTEAARAMGLIARPAMAGLTR